MCTRRLAVVLARPRSNFWTACERDAILRSSVGIGEERAVLLPVRVGQSLRVPEGGVLEALPQRPRRRHVSERHQQAL